MDKYSILRNFLQWFRLAQWCMCLDCTMVFKGSISMVRLFISLFFSYSGLGLRLSLVLVLRIFFKNYHHAFIFIQSNLTLVVQVAL